LRAVVFRDANLNLLDRGVEADFAIIWDADHDTRVIKAVEAIYRAGWLSSILMIGERKGTLHAVVCGNTQEDWRQEGFLRLLEGYLDIVAQTTVERDPWLSSLRTLANPDRKIIDDEDDKVRLYLANLKMLWRLGVRVSINHYLRVRTKKLGGKQQAVDSMNAENAAIVRSFPTIPDQLDAAEFEALWKAAEQIASGKKLDRLNRKTEKSESVAVNSAPKIRVVES